MKGRIRDPTALNVSLTFSRKSWAIVTKKVSIINKKGLSRRSAGDGEAGDDEAAEGV